MNIKVHEAGHEHRQKTLTSTDTHHQAKQGYEQQNHLVIHAETGTLKR